MTAARPATPLERAIARAQQGSVSPATLLWTLSASEIILLGTTAPSAGALPAAPFLLEDGTKTLLALFTHEERALPFREAHPAAAPVLGMTVLTRLPEGLGIIVNPGSRLGCEIPAASISEFVGELMGTVIDESS
ncbi:SseB family protein [Microterricola viridarii]|uniref:SseB protein N-terminal domain-containing protein n=1 Tax=Microterricola viridarii TaxID=412690 RepID=A0A1H1PYB9_9MICO|nr:SseB family protein [Microterricola viridarii]SDS16106.1 SseB protein N-terminal domain-containing protein [Microterricola viridarii]